MKIGISHCESKNFKHYLHFCKESHVRIVLVSEQYEKYWFYYNVFYGFRVERIDKEFLSKGLSDILNII